MEPFFQWLNLNNYIAFVFTGGLYRKVSALLHCKRASWQGEASEAAIGGLPVLIKVLRLCPDWLAHLKIHQNRNVAVVIMCIGAFRVAELSLGRGKTGGQHVVHSLARPPALFETASEVVKTGFKGLEPVFIQ